MFTTIQKLLLAAALLGFSTITLEATAQVHRLRERGKTLIEGEGYSATNDLGPRVQNQERCSGEKTLAYFWANAWFDLKLDAPRMLNYTLSFRASSELGSRFEIIAIDSSDTETLLAKVDIPKTGSWTKYENTQDVGVSIPAGVQTLRIKNVVEGANVDYITFTAGDYDDVVSTEPLANAGPNTNPLKGFNSGWWRENDDYASVGFQYVEWGRLEPKDDEFDWNYVEEVLNRSGSKGRHLILQLVVDWDDWELKKPEGDSHYKGPKWLLDKVGENRGPAFPGDPESRISRATRYDDPVFIEEATEAIKALIDHYRDDPRTFVIQIGVLGYWGEWHNYPRDDWSPSKSTKFAILDAYLRNIGPHGLTQVRYPNEPVAEPQARMGYTNGSATLTDHGIEFGAAIAKGQLWKNGPISGEWPPNVELKHFEKFFLSKDGLAFIDEGRYSTIFAPEAKEIAGKLPGWDEDGLFMKMHRRLGYNFQVSSVEHLVSVDDSNQTHIAVELYNSGISLFYKDWKIQLAVLESETAKVIDLIEIDADLRKLEPDKTLRLTGTVNAALDSKEKYHIGIRILQPDADRPKPTAWGLDARNTYIVLANEIPVVDGQWSQSNALQGGWNILDTVQRRQSDHPKSLGNDFFPLRGSFRPSSKQKSQGSEPKE